MDVETSAAPTTAPAAAVEAAPAAADVPRDAEAYTNWRMTGKVPEAKTSKAKTEASPASDAQKAEKSETAAESETAMHQESGKNAESRIKQLVAEKKALEAKLAEGAKPEAKETKTEAESSTAKPKESPKPETKLEAPKKPKLEDFKTYEEYDLAKDEYFEKLADFKAQKSLQDYRQQQVQEAQSKELATKLAEARTRYPDADQAIAPAAKAILEDAKIPPVIKAMVDDSPVMLDLLYVLGSKADELAAFVTLAQSKPLEAGPQAGGDGEPGESRDGQDGQNHGDPDRARRRRQVQACSRNHS